VDEAISTRAYEDVALPIGEGQTISQPYAVARMTEILLEEGPVGRVLEVGTGSGYQAAVLSQLVDVVFTVERIRNLLDKAKQRCAEAAFGAISRGWKNDCACWGARRCAISHRDYSHKVEFYSA